MRIEIEKLIYGGDGLARVEGEVVLTPFVLPGETAEVEREEKRAGIARARLNEIVVASAERVPAPCPYFGRCGGCHYQHAAYEAQLAAKRTILAETLHRVGKLRDLPTIEVISATPWGYRNRIQLHFANGRLGYHELRSRQLCAINQCPISSPRLNESIAALARMVKDRRWPSFLETAELFTNEEAVQFNVLETSRPLAQRFFDWCKEELPGFVSGSLEYEGYRVSYGSFFQVNRFLTHPLVDVVMRGAIGDAALDLYAGVGFFTLPISSRFASVAAVESGTSASRDLRFNAERIGARVDVRTESVDLFLSSLERAPDWVLADPPRSGLGKTVVRHMLELKPAAMTIVACDPATLARDARQLLDGGYAMTRLTLVDLFPQTFHIESVTEFRLR